MRKTYKPVVLEVLRKNGDIKYVAVVDTIEKRHFLFWSWFDCVNREYYSVKNIHERGRSSFDFVSANFWIIRRIDEIIPSNSVMFDNPYNAESIAKFEISIREKNELVESEMSIISANQIN